MENSFEYKSGGNSNGVTGNEWSDEPNCEANDNLNEIANSFISRCRKASIRTVFPGELLSLTLGEIKIGKTSVYRRGWKLLNDNRFKK